jgi:hypothetical protein
MRKGFPFAIALVFLAALQPALVRAGEALDTAFTYEGRLSEAGSPADGRFDLRFVGYDAAVGGSQVGPIVTVDDVAVDEGRFAVTLDFGSDHKGGRRWLEIAFRVHDAAGSDATYDILSPRRLLVVTEAHDAALPPAATAGVGQVRAGVDGTPTMCNHDEVVGFNPPFDSTPSVVITADGLQGAGGFPPNTFCVLVGVTPIGFRYCCIGPVPETVRWIAATN